MIVHGFGCHKGVRFTLLSLPSGLEPGDARQRGMWPVVHPVRSVLQGGLARDPSERGVCDPWPMAQECLDRVQASTLGPVQHEDRPVITKHGPGQSSGSHHAVTRLDLEGGRGS